MREREMDEDIVERFLMEKLEKEINAASEVALDNSKSLKCKQSPVQTELQGVQDLLKEKKVQTRAASKETRREKIYLLLNLTAEWREQLEKQQLCNPKALLPVDDIVGRLKKIRKELEEPPPPPPHKADNQQQSSSPHEVYRWSSPFNLSKIHGFGDRLQIMERLLLDRKSKAIGIVGVAGVGKTALVQQAYSHQGVRQHFLLRIWLCLSRQQKLNHDHDVALRSMLSCPGFEDQVKMMLRCLGLEDEVIDQIERGGPKRLEMALRRQLSRGRCLVVLDDAWTNARGDDVETNNDDAWTNARGDDVKTNNKLFSFLTESRYEGAVIVTSKSPEVEKMVGANNLQRLLPLADEESCWEIFKDAFKEDAFASREGETMKGELDILNEIESQKLENMEKVKPQIVGKCEGLPLMAKMLGKIGYSKTQSPKPKQEIQTQ